MTLEEDLDAQLRTIADLTAIVGNNIYPVALPKGVSATAAPWMTYQTVSHTEEDTLSGDAYDVKQRMVFNIRSANYSDVVAARKAIRAALGGFQGTFPKGTAIQLIHVANGGDFFEDTALLYRSMLSLEITYIETDS